MSILDVFAEDIVRLSDDVLAELLRRLIEAEASANGIPLNAVIYGGHNNAPDRGIDARVSWSGGPDRTGFFPRRTTMFQSKAETMSARRLKDEMAPGGVPRPLFEEFAEEHSAYVMFCGKDNCTEGMLRDRLIAMRSALSKVSQSDRLALDFYDVSRIARWVNTHAGVAAWLRDSLGRPLQGSVNLGLAPEARNLSPTPDFLCGCSLSPVPRWRWSRTSEPRPAAGSQGSRHRASRGTARWCADSGH